MLYFSKGTPLMKIYIALNLFSLIMVKTNWRVMYENQKHFCTKKHKKLIFYGVANEK